MGPAAVPRGQARRVVADATGVVSQVIKRMRNAARQRFGSSRDARWSRINTTLRTLRLTSSGNKLTPYYNTGDAYTHMWHCVDNARHTVTWHTYICKDDTVGQKTIEKLVAAHLRGVRVELLYDCMGNITGREGLVKPLVDAGATVTMYRPWQRHMWRYFSRGMQWSLSPGIRNHRKILVVDGEIGFIGGLNIGDDYAMPAVGGNGRFRDTMCAVEGPAVKHLQAVLHDTVHVQDGAKPHPSLRQRWRHWARTALPARVRARFEERSNFRRLRSLIQHALRRRRSSKSDRPIVPRGGHRSRVRKSLERLQQLRTQSGRLRRGMGISPAGVGSSTATALAAADAPELQPYTQILMCNPHNRDWSLQRALWIAVRQAHSRVWVTTPYFLPHQKLFRALLKASRAGLDCRVMVGSSTTTDPWFMWYATQYATQQLLAAGVKVYNFDGGKIMHAKTVVVDGRWACVGSYNWDVLSNKLLEASVAAYDRDFARRMETHFHRDIAQSHEVRMEDTEAHPVHVRVACWFFFHFVRVLEVFTFWDYSDRDVRSVFDKEVRR